MCVETNEYIVKLKRFKIRFYAITKGIQHVLSNMLEINKILASKESYPREESNENISKIIESHYAEVSTDCETCAMRSKGYKIFKKKDLQKCQSLSETLSMYQLPYSTMADEILKVHITLTNKRVKVYGKWDKEKLMLLLSERLLRRAKVEPPDLYEKIPTAKVKPILSRIPFDPVIHRGIYNEKVLEELYRNGMTVKEIIRVMKFGLRNLTATELDYFKCFNVTSEIMNSRKTWTQDLDDLLFTNLKAIGLRQSQCQSIVLHGIISQNECRLAQLIIGGIDVPGILSWQGAIISVSPRMIHFLRKLGIENDVLQLIVQKGIDEETLEMLKDLGYVETEEEEHPGMEEVVTCECSLTIIESVQKNNSRMTLNLIKGSGISETSACETLSTKDDHVCFNNNASSETNSTDPSIMPFFQQPICPCHMHPEKEKETPSELIAQRNDYLRQNVMVPLVWAMSKALQYRPSDPKHYIAYKLLSWKYRNVPKAEMEDVRNLVITATIEKDEQHINHKHIEEELEVEAYKEALKNIPCEPCSQSQQLHRIKRGCWKCVKKWIPKYRPCEIPESCSSCEVDLSDFMKSNTTSFSSYDSSIPDAPVPFQEKSYSGLVQDNNTEKELEYEESEGKSEAVIFSEYNIHKEAEAAPKKPNRSVCCPWRCDLPIPDQYTGKLSKLIKELSRNKSNPTIQKFLTIKDK